MAHISRRRSPNQELGELTKIGQFDPAYLLLKKGPPSEYAQCRATFGHAKGGEIANRPMSNNGDVT